MDMRVRVLEKKNDIDKLKEMLADKIGRDEFERSISELKHINIGQLQRNVEKMLKDIECIEVSNFAFLTIVQSYLENLALAMKNLERNQPMEMAPPEAIKFSLAAARQKGLDPQNCLSCGEPEVKQVSNNGLIGLHYRDKYVKGIQERSPANTRIFSGKNPDGSIQGLNSGLRSNYAIHDSYDKPI